MMKKFIFRIVIAVGLMCLALLVVLVVRIAVWEKRMMEVYSFPNDVEYVFIGNSHVGCTFVEKPEYHNRVIYVNSSNLLAFLWRLAELDNRGSLKQLKAVVFNYDTFGMGTSQLSVKADILREAPCALRHVDLLPNGYRHNAILPLFWSWHLWTVGDEQSSSDKSFVDRPKHEQSAMLKKHSGPFEFKKFLPETEFILREAKAICDKHEIRLILVATPLVSGHAHHARDKYDPLADAEKLATSMGLEYYDYRAVFPDSDLFDADHLTHSAACRFTGWFYENVLLQTGD